MARPYKTGLDFFYHDTSSSNTPIDVVEARFGLRAYAVYYKLLERVFSTGGYYTMFTPDDIDVFYKRYCDCPYADFVSIFSALCEYCFDINIYTDYNVITSADIQRIFIAAACRRRRIEIIDRLLLLPQDELPSTCVIIDMDSAIVSKYQPLYTPSAPVARRDSTHIDTFDHKSINDRIWNKLNGGLS